MAIVDKSKLLARRVAEDTVEIEGLGEVAVRGVTRYELLSAGKGVNEEKVPDLIERRMLVAGVAEPELTIELGRGSGAAHVYFSDLTHDYIRINAEYTT